MADRAASRRLFLTGGLGAAGAVLLGGRAPASPCHGARFRAVLAGAEEPGPRLRVRGRVFGPNGVRPAPGVTVYAYQTDVTGVYHPTEGRPPRLRGWMVTDAEGRFEYETIRPGSYPGTRNPAHIHHQLWGGGWPAQWSTDVLFEDDPLVTDEERRRSAAAGRFGSVRRARLGPDGTLEVLHELQLKEKGDPFEENMRHGLAECGLP